jgi:multicomponent Na+:H+ antiporter subunit A
MPPISFKLLTHIDLPNNVILTGISLILFFGAFTLLLSKRLMNNMVSFTVVGLAMSSIFIVKGALDVAMTQLLIEILTVIILVLALRNSTISEQKNSWSTYLFRFSIAIPLAVTIVLLVLLVLKTPLSMSLSHYFIDNGLVKAHGKNVVNLILIDYRAFDTFGEVMVIVATALAIWGLVRQRKVDAIEKNRES